MDIFSEIIRWNKERKIPKDFHIESEYNMLEEEITELYEATSDAERADALCDVIVIATGGLWKLGYSPEEAMRETLKEINSRGGSFNTESGKWKKEVTGMEYTANYKMSEVQNG